VEKQGIANGVILPGAGSVASHHFHVAASPVNPPKEDFTKGENPSDIVNIVNPLKEGEALF
jgi:hypothetical protein